MEPFAVLVLLPTLVGIASELVFRDALRASLAAALVSALAVYTCLDVLDPGGTWNALAGFLVSPLVMAVSLVAVLTCFGHFAGWRTPRRQRN
ncbi:MAG TPA: hypothetical protein VF925_12955 [Casimicrobiaceae bacterium]|jgi:hypothetical protein